MCDAPEKFDEIDDEILLDLANSSALLAEKVDLSDQHAVFTLAAKYLENDAGEESCQTFMMATGFLGVLGEGLYSELRDQIEKGNTSLFSIFRDVVRDLEEDLNIEPEEDFGEDGNEPTLH